MKKAQSRLLLSSPGLGPEPIMPQPTGKYLSRRKITRRTLLFQAIGFGLVIALLWLDECLDLPYLLVGAQPTPFNWRESILESVIVLIIGGQTCVWMYDALGRIQHLEKFVAVCPKCNRVYVRDQWAPIEASGTGYSDARFSQELCPNCEDVSPEDEESRRKRHEGRAR